MTGTFHSRIKMSGKKFEAYLFSEDEQRCLKIQRFTLPRSELDFGNLKEKLRSIFGNQSFKIFWNDKIPISSEDKLQICLENHPKKDQVVKLILIKTSGLTNQVIGINRHFEQNLPLEWIFGEDANAIQDDRIEEFPSEMDKKKSDPFFNDSDDGAVFSIDFGEDFESEIENLDEIWSPEWILKGEENGIPQEWSSMPDSFLNNSDIVQDDNQENWNSIIEDGQIFVLDENFLEQIPNERNIMDVGRYWSSAIDHRNRIQIAGVRNLDFEIQNLFSDIESFMDQVDFEVSLDEEDMDEMEIEVFWDRSED